MNIVEIINTKQEEQQEYIKLVANIDVEINKLTQARAEAVDKSIFAAGEINALNEVLKAINTNAEDTDIDATTTAEIVNEAE